MEEYPGNSDKEKREPKKKVDQVITGRVIRKPTPMGRKFASTFFGGTASGVMTHVVTDVLLPAARDMLAEAINQGIERMLYGEVRNARPRTSTQNKPGYSGTTYTSYNRYSNGGPLAKKENPRPATTRGRSVHDFDDIILATRAEANQIIDRMYDLVENYGQVSISDLYAMIGVTADYTDDKWGWLELEDIEPRKTRDGYLLQLPRPVPLD